MLNRKIIFHRWASANPQKLFDPKRAIKTLAAGIGHSDEYAILATGDVTTAVLPVSYDDDTPKPVRLQMLALRTASKLPAKWRPDAPLESIPLLEGEYSADVTHLCMWQDGVVAQEFHHNAPRVGRLSHFLRKKLDEQMLFNPLYQPDMLTKLEGLRGQLRSVHLAFTKPDYATDLSTGVFGSLLPEVFGKRAPSVNVQIGMGKYGPRNRFLDEGIEQAVFELAENAHEIVDRLVVSGINPDTGKAEHVNLLSERLLVEIQLPEHPSTNSVPDSDATFEALENARLKLDGEGLIARATEAQAMRNAK
ncbi:hypothetical protein SAMN05216553_102473 [Lentzea fradiae]|uniref:Uncharacterized protein n=1 Tax=Lentzea fradiae TaxID=200378 RepID=A0A1G7MRY1_9PSEU|nr:DUF6731 family protein [Lentzea fradiae]SDF64467.1 hypothetical protein SAMN05216553_102473 [Lentzea fradiae]